MTKKRLWPVLKGFGSAALPVTFLVLIPLDHAGAPWIWRVCFALAIFTALLVSTRLRREWMSSSWQEPKTLSLAGELMACLFCLALQIKLS